MVKESFKIGDKVKLKNPDQFSCGSKVLEIIGFSGDFICVYYKGINWNYFPLYPNEVEYAVKVGEQLVFAFM